MESHDEWPRSMSTSYHHRRCAPHLDGGVCLGGVLTPAAAAKTVVIRENGAAGPILLTVIALANGASVPIPGPF
jgi:hypothetical protein